MAGTVSTADEGRHAPAGDTVDDIAVGSATARSPSESPALQPHPPSIEPRVNKRKGTPTRSLERQIPVGWAEGTSSMGRGAGRSRVHGQYVLRKEQTSEILAKGTGASELSASCTTRGYVPAVVTMETTQYAEMKAWIRAMAREHE